MNRRLPGGKFAAPVSAEVRLARRAYWLGCGAVAVAAGLGLTSLLFRTLDPAKSLPPWVVPTALALTLSGVLLVVFGKRAEWSEKRAKADREWVGAVAPLLRLPPRQGKLPCVAEVPDIEWGATRTRYSVARTDQYVDRPAVDDRLREALHKEEPCSFVLLHGESKAGKSRTLSEAVKCTHSTSEIIVPRDANALAELAHLDPPLPLGTQRVVAWLDDLTPAGLNQLTAAVLDFWQDRALIVATMTTTRYQDVLRTGSEVGGTARAALARAAVYELQFELTESELAKAHELYPDEDAFAQGAEHRVSIGETLVGGEELLGKLHAGANDCPAGQAIVHAAVDARRAGLSRLITLDELRHLFPSYLDRITSGTSPTSEQFTIGMKWATAPVASQVALLRRTSSTDETFDVLDYVIAAESGRYGKPPRSIPNFLWPQLLAATTPADALDIGTNAFLAGYQPVAMSAFQVALQHAQTEADAALFLGLLLAGHGDDDGARRAYQRAIDTGQPREATMAALYLGVLLKRQGDDAGARTVYQRAIDFGHPEHAPEAAFNLGLLLVEQGDIDGAQRAYQRTIDTGHPEHAPKAMINLGLLLVDQGDEDGAWAAFERAIGTGHPEHAPAAAFNLGMLLRRQGDDGGARTVFEWAIDTGQPREASAAMINLGALLKQQGDVGGARRAYQRAIDTGHPEHVPMATFNLGLLLAEQGDVDGAQTAFDRAIDTGHSEYAPGAAYSLGVVLAEQGDADGARTAYERAISLGHSEYAPRAAFNLAALLKQEGEVDGARRAYQYAIDNGQPMQAAKALINLGLLLKQEGEVDGARSAYQQAIDTGEPEHSPMAAFNLGVLLAEQGNVDGAKTAYQWAIDTGHAEVVARAASHLGLLLDDHGDIDGARTAYEQAIDTRHPKDASTAALNLGLLLKQEGDLVGARRALEWAIDAGHPEYAARAAFNLGLLLAEQGDVNGARTAYQWAVDSGHTVAAPAAAELMARLPSA